MKKISIINLTKNGTILFKESSHFKEGTFQGFTIVDSFVSRYHFASVFIGKAVQCSMSKDSKKIRYHDIDVIKAGLRNNMLKINEKELNESKIFTPEEKKQIVDYLGTEALQNMENLSNVIDLVNNRKLISKYYQLLKESLGKI